MIEADWQLDGPTFARGAVFTSGGSNMPANTETRPWRHLYGRRWGRERLVHLARHPLCAMCEAKGQVTAATVVDHKQPHRGDAALFWDRSNWQSLCAPHHDRTKQIIEKAGAEAVHDIDGYKEGW